jgi:type II secretory ATPase GspE/PulE/Tfp pilus assembly ATPase PilB-like protein
MKKSVNDDHIAADIVALEQILTLLPDDQAALEALSIACDLKGDRRAARRYLLRLSEVCLAKRDGECAIRLVERLEEPAEEDAQCRRLLTRMAELVATTAQDQAAQAAEVPAEPSGSVATGRSAPEEPPEPHLSATAIRTANMILVEAIRRNASHVHLDPGAKVCSVYLTIDEVHHELPAPPMMLAADIVDFYRCEAGLDLEEQGISRRGRFVCTALGKECDIALQVTQTQHGLAIALEFTGVRVAPPNYDDIGPCIQ